MLATRLAACNIFTYPGLHFLFALGTPLWQSRKTLHEWKHNSVLPTPLAACTHLSWTVSQLFEPQVQKIAVFTYRSPHFCFSWRRPFDYNAICCIDGKTIQCLPNTPQHVPIYLQKFPSYTMLKSMRKSKNRQSHYSKDGLLLSAGIRHITATQAEVKEVPACERKYCFDALIFGNISYVYAKENLIAATY